MQAAAFGAAACRVRPASPYPQAMLLKNGTST
jgi:hypothetical protein